MDDAHGTLRTLVGKVVRVACADGQALEGTLVNVNRRSLWLVSGEDDVLLPWASITQVT